MRDRKGRLRLDLGGLVVKAIDQGEERHVSSGPAVHGSMANSALGIAPLPERQAGRGHFVFGPTIRTFEDHHGFTPSDRDNLLSEQNFSLHTPAVRAFKLVD